MIADDGVEDERLAYALAAAYILLPHDLLHNWAVSRRTLHGLEAWTAVDTLPRDRICTADVTQGPWILNYQGEYRLGDWGFHGSRLPTMPWSCQSIPVDVPPPTLPATRWTLVNGNNRTLSEAEAAREAYLICRSLQGYAQGLQSWQQRRCGAVPPVSPYEVRWRLEPGAKNLRAKSH